MREKLFKIEGLGRKVLERPNAVKNALSVFVLADIAPQITTTTSLLPLEPWQIVVAKIGAIAFLTGTYAGGFVSTLHANEGRTRFQKRIANGALIATGLGTAAFDVLIASFPF